MKRIICVCLIIVLSLSVFGCASDMNYEGKHYKTYGLFNKDEVRDPFMEYELVWGNVILGALLFETVIAPIYFYGFSIWEPVGPKEAKQDAPY